MSGYGAVSVTPMYWVIVKPKSIRKRNKNVVFVFVFLVIIIIIVANEIYDKAKETI
jgi:hypothetical protein